VRIRDREQEIESNRTKQTKLEEEERWLEEQLEYFKSQLKANAANQRSGNARYHTILDEAEALRQTHKAEEAEAAAAAAPTQPAAAAANQNQPPGNSNHSTQPDFRTEMAKWANEGSTDSQIFAEALAAIQRRTSGNNTGPANSNPVPQLPHGSSPNTSYTPPSVAPPSTANQGGKGGGVYGKAIEPKATPAPYGKPAKADEPTPQPPQDGTTTQLQSDDDDNESEEDTRLRIEAATARQDAEREAKKARLNGQES